MSIAVSAVVEPSRRMLVLISVLAIGILFIAAMVGAGAVGDLLPAWRLGIAVGLVAISFIAIYRSIGCIKSLHIDISDNGQITVEEDNALAASASQAGAAQQGCCGRVVRLLPNSTLWPCLLLLRLQEEDQTVRTVLIFPDCMGAGSFRALSVACRWIAAHNDHAER